MKLRVLLSAACCLLASLSAAETTWVPSDSLGRWDTSAPRRAEAGKGWYLGLERLGDQEKRTLVLDGEVQRIFLIDLDSAGRPARNRVFQSGQLIQDITYLSGSNQPEKETLFAAGEPRFLLLYTFGVSGLLKRKVEDPDGKFLFEDVVYRFPDGRLRRLERNGPDGPLAEVSWSYNEKGVSQVWVADEDLKSAGRHKLITYSDGTVREDLLEDTTLLLSRVTSDLDEGQSLEKQADPKSGTTTERKHDTRGRLIQETVTDSAGVSTQTRWTWDDKDRIVREETDIRGGMEVTTFTYTDDGISVAEKRRLNVLESRETRKDGEKTLVELFDRGEKFLEEEWDNGRKMLERYFQDGVVVRERKL